MRTALKISAVAASTAVTALFGMAVYYDANLVPDKITTREQAMAAPYDSAVYRLGLARRPAETIYQIALPDLTLKGIASSDSAVIERINHDQRISRRNNAGWSRRGLAVSVVFMLGVLASLRSRKEQPEVASQQEILTYVETSGTPEAQPAVPAP